MWFYLNAIIKPSGREAENVTFSTALIDGFAVTVNEVTGPKPKWLRSRQKGQLGMLKCFRSELLEILITKQRLLTFIIPCMRGVSPAKETF